MNIRYYAEILMRRKWIILATLLTIELAVVVFSFKATPIYSATTTMRIASASSGSITSYDYLYADRLMNTYIKLATTIPVLDELQKKLGLSELPEINVKSISDTELIQLTVQHHNPEMAALAANTLAGILIAQSQELYTGSEESSLEILSKQVTTMEQEVNLARVEYTDLAVKNPQDTEAIQRAKEMLELKQRLYSTVLEQYEQTRLNESLRANMISIVEPANIPNSPAQPRKALNIALGFMVGLIVGVGLAFLIESIDSTLHSTAQVEQVTKMPIVGRIPDAGSKQPFDFIGTNFTYGEAFRRMRTHILSVEPAIHTLMITSAEPNDGKSRIAADLAYVMAQSGQNVVLIDADLRSPVQHKLFNIENKVGLSDILEQKVSVSEALQWCGNQGVQVLPSGRLPTNPSELLGTNQTKLLISQLSSIYDLVIIDTPAALVVAESIALAPLVDAVVLVICRGKTSSTAVNLLLTQVNSFKLKWLGVIFNRAKLNTSHYYYYQKQPDIRNKLGFLKNFWTKNRG